MKILPEYADYIEVFSSDLRTELLKNTGINKDVIKLVKDKQPSYRSIYSLNPVKLETLKTFIKTYQKIEFKHFFKFPIGIPIFFNKKPNSNLCLYIDYWNFNNLIIKNYYFLLFIYKSLNYLGYGK